MRPPSPGPRRNFFGDGVGVRMLLVQMSLDVGNQPVDLPPVIDIDQELHEGAVLPFRTVDEHEAQAAAADERRDMGDAGQSLDVPLDVAGERLRLADVGAGRQKDIHHELRPGRGREEALLDLGEAVERRDERHDAKDHHRPAEAERQHQQTAVDPERQAAVRIAAAGCPTGDRLEEQVTQQRRDGDRRHPAQAQGNQDDPEQRVGVLRRCCPPTGRSPRRR